MSRRMPLEALESCSWRMPANGPTLVQRICPGALAASWSDSFATTLLYCLGICAVIFVPGCGGGSSGSATVAPPPPPSPPAFRFSAQNARLASAVALRSVEQAKSAAQFLVSLAESMTTQGLTEIPIRCNSSDASAMPVATYDDNDASGRISSGDTIRFNTEDCGDAVSDFRMEVTAVEVSESRIVSLVGSVNFSLAAAPESSADAIESEGSLKLDYTVAEASKTLDLAEIETSATSNGQTDELTEGRLEEVIVDLKYTVDFSGHLDALGGMFDFETEVAFSGRLGSFPTNGELELDAENSSVSVKPSANPELEEHADYRIDTAGTGQYGAAEAVRWLDLMSGSLFNWYSLINALYIDPPHPFTTNSLIAVPIIYNPQGTSSRSTTSGK